MTVSEGGSVVGAWWSEGASGRAPLPVSVVSRIRDIALRGNVRAGCNGY